MYKVYLLEMPVSHHWIVSQQPPNWSRVAPAVMFWLSLGAYRGKEVYTHNNFGSTGAIDMKL